MKEHEQILPQGTKAPNFTLPLGDGNPQVTEENLFKLSSVKGKNLILAFYPADWSDVCSSQIALYNELLPVFEQYNAEIYGISVDGTFCHAAFKKNNNMKIKLLCDFEPKGQVSRLYGAYNKEAGFSERALYVIDKDGIIQYSYLSPIGENPGAKEILETLKKIEK